MTISSPVKIALCIGVIVLTSFTFYLVDWQKKAVEQRQLSAVLVVKMEEYDRYVRKGHELPTEIKRNEQLTAELAGIMEEQFSPESDEDIVPACVADIEDLVGYLRVQKRDRHFLITVLDPGTVVEETGNGCLEGFPGRTFLVQLTGRYSTIVDFLRQLGALKLKRLVTINRLSLSLADTVIPGQSPALSVNMPMTAYVRPGY